VRCQCERKHQRYGDEKALTGAPGVPQHHDAGEAPDCERQRRERDDELTTETGKADIKEGDNADGSKEGGAEQAEQQDQALQKTTPGKRK
jgi:hypothetical protein